MPPALMAKFQADGIVFFDEGIRGTVTYKNYRGPGRYSNWKRQWFSSTIVLTNKGLIAYRLRQRIIDVPLDDPKLKQMRFAVENGDKLLAAFDAELFQPGWSGTIEYRFSTPFAQAIYDRLMPHTLPS